MFAGKKRKFRQRDDSEAPAPARAQKNTLLSPLSGNEERARKDEKGAKRLNSGASALSEKKSSKGKDTERSVDEEILAVAEAASAAAKKSIDAPKSQKASSNIVASKPAANEHSQKSFADLGVIEPLCDACTQLGYKAPTPIQVEAIPVVMEGRDVIGIAETGSGKTAAFALPILQALMDKPQPFFALILAPTRELALQISQQFEALGALIAVRCAVLVGGMDMVPQAIALGRKPHIVVATPGRLLDHLENTKGFSLRLLKYLVMDEADRLLDLDFGPILEKILRVLPRGAGRSNQQVNGNDVGADKAVEPSGRRTMLFSATMSAKVEHLQRASLTSPVRVSVAASDHQTVATLRQSYIFIPHKHKDLYLVYLLAGDRSHIGGGGNTGGIIVFTRTVSETQRLSILLRTLGLSAVPIHGQLSQSSRLSALNRFKAGRSYSSNNNNNNNDTTSSSASVGSTDILVATDIAARGLDIPAVSAVINYDLPPDSKTYVHRVGRTARAGRAGAAVSFVTQYDVEIWLRIERALGRKVEQLNATASTNGNNEAATDNDDDNEDSDSERSYDDDGDDNDHASTTSSSPPPRSKPQSSTTSDTRKPKNRRPTSKPPFTAARNPILKDQVLILMPRVSEAQRLAARELRDMQENRGKKGSVLIGKRRMGRASGRGGRGGRGGGGGGGGGRGGDDMDMDEG